MKDNKFNVLDAIGNTPLIKIDNVYAKLESVNPSGSIKDRVALEIIEAAEKEVPKEEYDQYSLVYGVDVGGGVDPSAMCKRQGMHVFPFESFSGS